MILQCNPLIPLDTPKGLADAHFLIDYGRDAHLVFVCFVRATGECWCIEGPAVLLQANVTAGVRQPDNLKKVREEWGPSISSGDLTAFLALAKKDTDREFGWPDGSWVYSDPHDRNKWFAYDGIIGILSNFNGNAIAFDSPRAAAGNLLSVQQKRNREAASKQSSAPQQQVNDHEVCARDYAATLAAGKNVHEHGGEG